MFKELHHKHEWVLDPLVYENEIDLIEVLEAAVIKPAEEKHSELLARKVGVLQMRSTKDYRNA